MRPLIFTFLITLGCGLICSSSISLAQNDSAGSEAPIGKVVSATGSVTIEHAVAVVIQANLPSGVGPAKTGDFVYQGDVVQTGPDGKLALTFTDGTAFNLSNNGRMVLNEFIYNSDGKSNSTMFSLTKGTFTFVAGKVAKTGNMTLDTPVATMGIRGTTPNVEIADDGTVKFSTLVEGKKDLPAANSRLNQRNLRPATGRRAQANKPANPMMSPEQSASYNRLFNLDPKVCRGC